MQVVAAGTSPRLVPPPLLLAGPAGGAGARGLRAGARGKPAGAREAVGLADRFVFQDHDPDRSFEEMAKLFGLVGAAAQRG